MSAQIKTGGPAFPQARVTVLAEDGTPNESCAVSHDGATLRDYFAAKAMGVALHRCNIEYDGFKVDWMAKKSYEIADAMLAAREVTP